MEIVGGIVLAMLGSTGMFSLVQFLITRHDNNKGATAQIKSQLNAIENKCDRNELATTRLQILFLIESQPDNKDAILQTAQRYFVELHGNGEAWAVFNSWADSNNIDLGWYRALLESKKGK